MLQMDFPWQRPFGLRLDGAIALLDVEIDAAGGAKAAAIGLAQDNERRVHDDRVVDRLTQIDDAILAQQLIAVFVGLGSSGSSKR